MEAASMGVTEVSTVAVRRIIERSLTLSKEEIESTYIITSRPLADVVDILGIIKPVVVNISERDNEKGVYVPPRRIHEIPPLAFIAEPLGIEVTVEFYDINGIPVYYVREPKVDEFTVKLYAFLRQRVGEMVVTSAGELINAVRDVFADMGVDARAALSDPSVKSAIYFTFRDMLGYGPLEVPMEDPEVEEVSWFSYDGPVQVVDKKVVEYYPNSEFIPTNIFFDPKLADDQKKFFMLQVVRAVTSKGHVGLTTARPIAEARIPDPRGRGFHRLAAHLDIVSRSPAVTIRKFPQRKLSITELIRFGTISSFEAAYLIWQLANRGFILIVGAMASGKTTLLQSLISALPAGFKVITIEDTPELSTPAQNWHPLYTRWAPRESELENVDYNRLVIHSLRHRGTVVTLGEVRGSEMASLVQAASSGHGAICLPGDSRVVARIDGRAGVYSIREVVEAYESGSIVEAYSLDPETRSFRWAPVTASIRVRGRKWVHARTASGRELVMTDDHRVLVASGDGLRFKLASELRPGDKVLVPARLPREGSTRYVECCGYMVELDRRTGALLARLLAGDPPREAPIPAVAGRKGRGVSAFRLSRFKRALLELVVERPLSLPEEFLEGFATTAEGRTLRAGRSAAWALHYALKTIGVDSTVKGDRLLVRGRVDGDYYADEIVEVKLKEREEEAYDIEVGGTHTFIADGVVTGNCTFHSQDPEDVLARITSPPINLAPETLRLITSIVHISRTKTYARGRPESVRRVVRIFEITDVKGRNVRVTTTFRWNPATDTHHPQLTLEGLRELWCKSKTVRTIGASIYVDEAPKALVEIYVIAKYLEYMTKRKIYDIKEVLYNMTSLYLRLDGLVKKLWEGSLRSLRRLPLNCS